MKLRLVVIVLVVPLKLRVNDGYASSHGISARTVAVGELAVVVVHVAVSV